MYGYSYLINLMLYNLRTPTTKECMDTAITIYSKNGNTISNNNAIWDEHPHANDCQSEIYSFFVTFFFFPFQRFFLFLEFTKIIITSEMKYSIFCRPLLRKVYSCLTFNAIYKEMHTLLIVTNQCVCDQYFCVINFTVFNHNMQY